MKRHFPDEQIISLLGGANAGVSDRELCLRYAISDDTFYTKRNEMAK